MIERAQEAGWVSAGRIISEPLMCTALLAALHPMAAT